MKEFMKGGDIYLNKTQSLLLLAGVIVIALLSFLLGFLTNQPDKSSLTGSKNKEVYKEVSSKIAPKQEIEMNIQEPPLVDEKSDIKETELTFYKTLANSPETKKIQQPENIAISKKSEPVYSKSSENKITVAKVQKKQEGVTEVPENVTVALDEEDKAVEVDSKFGHLNIASNSKKIETQNEELSTDQKRDVKKEEVVHKKEETAPKIAVDAGLKPIPDDAGLPTIKPENERVPEKKGGGGLYTVQVASFTAKEEAFNLKNKLEKKGFDSYIVSFMKGDVKWFRVRVGSLNSKEEASQISKKIKEEIKLNSFVTSYER